MSIKVTGSSLARNIFGQDLSTRTVAKTQPLLGFQFYVKINYDPLAKLFIKTILGKSDFKDSTALVKSVTMPSMSIDTKVLSSYNRKRLSQSKINFDPVQLVFHDVVGGASLAIWQMYYNWYFNDGLSSLSLKKEWLTSPPWESIDMASLMDSPAKFAMEAYSSEGMNITALKKFGYASPYIRYLFKSIDIYQVHGATYNKVTIFNPMVTNFSHDTMAYDKNELVQMTFSFMYEWAEYEIKNRSITSEMRSFFERSNVIDFVEFEPSRTNTPDGSFGQAPTPGILSNSQTPLGAPVSRPPTASPSVTDNQFKFDTIKVQPEPTSVATPQTFSSSASSGNSYVDVRRAK